MPRRTVLAVISPFCPFSLPVWPRRRLPPHSRRRTSAPIRSTRNPRSRRDHLRRRHRRPVVCPWLSRAVRHVTAAQRVQVYAEYGVADVPGLDEVDHFIPLELGGSNDIANLWP